MSVRRSPDQLALPFLDERPRCPLCGQHVNVLGQWSPFQRKACCRACSERDPFPQEIVALVGGELVIVLGLSNVLYERRLAGEERLRAATRKRVYHAPRSTQTFTRFEIAQLSIPVCDRCGHAHDHWHISDYAAYCQRCDDELAVEVYWRGKGTILIGDDEEILDRLHRIAPELFERGVLPDYWFALRVRR